MAVTICVNEIKGSVAAAEISNVKLAQGAVVTKLKPARLINGILVLSTPIQTTNLEQKLEYLKRHLPTDQDSKILIEHIYQKCHSVMVKRRTRRSLFDLGGTLLKQVIGTATEKDIQALQEETGLRLATQEVALKHTQKFMNATQHNIELIGKTLGNVTHVIEGMMNKWKIMLTVWNMESLCDELAEIKQHFQNGVFDVRMLDERSMNEAINEYARKWKLNPMYEPGTENFRKTIKTRLITIAGVNYGLVKIPFFGRLGFDTYKIQALPMYTGDVSKGKYVLKSQHEYVLVSNEEFITLTKQQFDRCRKSVPNYIICPKFLAELIPKYDLSNCLLNIILENKTENCVFEKSTLKTSYIQTDDKFVISSEPDLGVTVTCMGMKTVRTKLSRTGLGIFASACGLKSKIFHWQKSKLVEEANTIKMYFHTPDVNISLHREDALSKLVNEVKMSLNESRELLSSTGEDNNYYSLHKNVIHTYISVTTVIMVGLAAVVIVIFCKGKKRYRKLFATRNKDNKHKGQGLRDEQIGAQGENLDDGQNQV